MKITVLIDNIASGALCAEWEPAIHIEYMGHSILLDTGGKAYELLKNELGEKLQKLYAGLVIEI